MLKCVKLINEDSKKSDEIFTGTTIMALKYKDGIVIGADSRTSSGSFIVNRVSDKLTKITDHIYCCRSGSTADTQAIADATSYELDLLKHSLDSPLTVKMAANIMKHFAYTYRDQLTAGIIVAGWDPLKGAQIYSVPVGGMLIEQNFAVGGSGSIYIQGLLDQTYGDYRSRGKKDTIDYLKKLIFSAITRDAVSGGVVRIASIDKNGVERFLFMSDDHEPIPYKHD